MLRAITGATVLDGTGRAPLPDGVVLLDGDRVRSVSRAADTVVPEQAEVIDAAGRYVIPGLMDANVHLFGAPLPDVLLEHEDGYAAFVEEAAQVTLRASVTTVFDTWGPLGPLQAVRDAIDRGDTAGSRIRAGGNIIGFGGPLSPDFFPPGDGFGPDTVERINGQWEHGVGADLLWCTPEQVRSRVRDYVDRHRPDFLKYAASGHATAFITFSAAAQRVIVEEGHRAGITVQAHTTTVESLRMEIEAGTDLLQHGDITGLEPMPEETLKTIVDRRLPVAAMLFTERHHAWVAEHGSPMMRRLYNTHMDGNDRRLVEAGARLLLTTDAFVWGPRLVRHPAFAPFRDMVDTPTRLGESHILWLQGALERGMAPMEALLSATRYIAEAYHVADEVGTLEPGKRADLVILEADPLADVQNYTRIAAVLKDGAVVDRDALPLRPVITTR